MIKKLLLLIAVTFGLVYSSAFAGKSELEKDPLFGPDQSSFPQPFNSVSNDWRQPAVSTGYYFVDSDERSADQFWRPDPTIVALEDETDGVWVRIEPGPRTKPGTAAQREAEWEQSFPYTPDYNGRAYFRNPAYPQAGYNWFEDGSINATDSTDDAIAGPMPLFINGGFYFNGIRYDSFYVSTNGIIALTNRRYKYDPDNGQRKNENGDCYDRMSMDWFVGSFYQNGTVDRRRWMDLNPGQPAESATNTNIEKVVDDFGYQFAVLGGDRWNPTAGIRTRGGNLKQFGDTYTPQRYHKYALIAPFFGDLHLSQFNARLNIPEDHGQAWFRKYDNGNKLVIYIKNAAPVRSINLVGATVTGKFDLRPGDGNYVSASAQVVLDRTDSSITINYEQFSGSIIQGSVSRNSQQIFRFNTTAGVSGYARHTNYSKGTSGSSAEYFQYTHYFSYYTNLQVDYPRPQMAVKFKQWQNTLRVVDISYRVRSLDANDDLSYQEVVPTIYVNNYELLAGEERIGAIQPVAIIQNLTNDIQAPYGFSSQKPWTGINYVPQDLNFRARFRIVNQALDKPIYNRLVPIDSAGLAIPAESDAQSEYFGDPNVKVRYSTIKVSGGNVTATNYQIPNPPGYTNLNGIPPYGFVEVYFNPFEPNEYVQDKKGRYTNIGRMKAMVLADPTDPFSGAKLGDEWPFDDQQDRQLFVMKRLENFSDNVSEYHIIEHEVNGVKYGKINMPSVEKWVNIEAEVQSGENVSYHPLPPRRQWNPELNRYQGYEPANSDIFGKFEIYSPVIRMDRKTLIGADESPGGDELRSFPVDLRTRFGAVLSVSAQRTENSPNTVWDRGWCDDLLIGPEHRAIINSNIFDPFTTSNSVSATPDELRVEIAQSSPDAVHGITNIGVALPFIPGALRGSWNYHPRRGGAKPVTNMSAYLLYGGGGYMRGFLEEDKDSALSPPTIPSGPEGGLRADVFDDGIDEEFQKMFVAIPDTFISAANEGAKNFRFRVRVNATNDQKCMTCRPDDDDIFFVDNTNILFPKEITDVEVSSCRIIWPYTEAPASQVIKVPVRVQISNNTSVPAPTFYIKVKIFRGNYMSHEEDAVYCKVEQLPYLGPGSEVEVKMPDWDARKSGNKEGGQYHMLANVFVPGGDIEILNDTTYFDFKMNFGGVFAYDPAQNPHNDVPPEYNPDNPNNGAGLNLMGYAYGGQGNTYSATGWSDIPYAFGYEGGNSSGQIAMQFELFQVDTVKGYQAYFGPKNLAPDYISFMIYTDQNDAPGAPIAASKLERTQRGRDDLRKGWYYDEYVTYLLPEPVILQRGKYWVAVAQLGETGFELGASASRMGMRTTQIYIPPPSGGYVGTFGNSLMIKKEFRQKDNEDRLFNKNVFAFENTAYSGAWTKFMGNYQNPAYAHLHHYGVLADGVTWSLSRGTWIPMLRPYLGERYVDPNPKYEECDVPVELSYFNGKVRESVVDLFWETASEKNNEGFYVERKLNSETNWKEIGFVKGHGNSYKAHAYKYTDDKNLVRGEKYDYRLRQVDLDGGKGCESLTQIVTVTISDGGGLVLNPNRPNPVKENTEISFVMPQEGHAKLEILDIYGNVVKTLVDADLSSDQHFYNWNRYCNDGSRAASGAYIYRLTVGDNVKTGKMTVVN